MSDVVNHPKHYTSHPSGVEAIEICEDLDFCVGNAVKYLFRVGLKDDALQDLKKAAWYLRRAHAGSADYSSPRRDVLQRVLDREPASSVLDDVLRVLFVDRASTNFWGAMAQAIARVEREIAKVSER